MQGRFPGYERRWEEGEQDVKKWPIVTRIAFTLNINLGTFYRSYMENLRHKIIKKIKWFSLLFAKKKCYPLSFAIQGH